MKEQIKTRICAIFTTEEKKAIVEFARRTRRTQADAVAYLTLNALKQEEAHSESSKR